MMDCSNRGTKNPLVVVSSLSPASSSNLPTYIEYALGDSVRVLQIYPKRNRIRTFYSLSKSFRLSKKRWSQAYEKETEHTLASWNRYSAQLIQYLGAIQSDAVVQVGLHFNSFPTEYSSLKCLYLHGTLSMVLSSRYNCDMWLPKPQEIELWVKNEMETMAEADKIFLGAHHLKSHILEHYKIDPDKLVFVGTGTPPFPELTSEDQSIGKQPNPTILFVGKDFERKGGYILLDAFNKVVKEVPKAELHIVGPRDIGKHITNNVFVHGQVKDRAFLRQLFLTSHVFVMPTLHDSFGFTFLEAMSFGLPCIGTNIFAIPEIIENGKTGIVVPAFDSDALSEALITILENSELRIEMGKNGYAKYKKEFNWTAVGKRMRAHMNMG